MPTRLRRSSRRLSVGRSVEESRCWESRAHQTCAMEHPASSQSFGATPHWRARVLMVCASAAIIVCAVLVAVTWRVAGQRARSTDELTAQASLLVSLAGLIVSTILAGTTIYYALLTRRLVEEAQSARLAEQQWRISERRLAQVRALEGAGAALIGSTADAVGGATLLATLIRHRRVWRVRTAMEPLLQIVSSAARALDQLRYLGPPEVVEAAGDILDSLLRLSQAAGNGSSQRELTELGREIFERKIAFEAALHLAVERFQGVDAV